MFMHSPLYRYVAIAKALLILAAGVAPAMQYLREHGFSEVEAKSILTKKGR